MMRGTQAGTMSPTRVGVGIPLQESSGAVLKWVGLVAILAAVGGGVFWFTQQNVPPEVSAGAAPALARPTVDVAGQFLLAEKSLAAGQLSQALIAVDAILFAEPNNEDAAALKERVNEAMENMQVAPPVVAQPAPAQPAPRGASKIQRATALAADASLSIGAGDLAQAEALIAQGRGLDPGSPRWQQLDQQLRRARDDAASRARASAQQAEIDQYIVEATGHLKAQNYQSAIAAYDKALAVAPNNPQLINARNMAQTVMQQAASVTALSIKESPTEFTAQGQSDTPRGFESGGVNVQRATSAPVNPADLIVQIVPTTVQPGDPYFLRVRIYNRGNRPIGVKSLELVSTFGSRTTGRGQPLQPMVQRINPKDTSLIWEVQNTWTEEQNTGKIEAVVTLIGNAQLRKTIEWR
jgi:tetratricopeptide (TPR) repeat protein